MTTYFAILGVALVMNAVHVVITGEPWLVCISGCN